MRVCFHANKYLLFFMEHDIYIDLLAIKEETAHC